MISKGVEQITKYQYSSEEEYLLSKGMEEVKFALYKAQRQLESAVSRIKDLKFEVKLFIGILIIIIVLNDISYAMFVSGSLLTVPGIILNEIFSYIYLIGLPICFYKIIKGMIAFGTTIENEFARQIAGIFSLSAFSSEILECQIYIQKYKLAIEDLELWKDNLTKDIPVDKSTIENRINTLDLNPKIPLAFYNSRKLKCFSFIVSITIFVIIEMVL